MEIVHSIFDFKPTHETFVTIGTFDGVHIGHQKIIDKLVDQAKKQNKKSVLLTFFPHPRMVLQKDTSIKLLNTIEERSELLRKTGLDYLIIHPFSEEFSRLKALDFVRDVLVSRLNTFKLIIGYDHHFGKNREGNIEQLTEYSEMYDFTVEEIPAQDIDSVSVSSTKVRKALDLGDLNTANDYLGYNYSLKGKVTTGNKLGSTIGYPTANLFLKEEYKLVPKNGVYVVKSILNGVLVWGMMNIGNRPTVDGDHQTVETNFFDFSDDLYEKEIEIQLLHFLRDEQKFESVDKLVEQLKIDEKIARAFISNNL